MTARTQPVAAPSGGRYGQRKAIEDAQREIPLPNSTPAPVSGAAGPQGGPVQRPAIFGATERPNEPLTAGAALGPGPASLGMLPDDPVAHLRELYLQFPSDDLRRLLERAAELAADRR